MPLKPIEVDMVKVPVEVNSNGQFEAEVDGDTITSPTYKSLAERVKLKLRTAGRVEIKVTLLSEYWRNEQELPEDVVLTGIHSGNRNVLYHAEKKGSPTEQLRYNEAYRRFTPDEKREWADLQAERKRIQAAIDAFKRRRKVNPKELIEEAQAELMKGKATT